MRPQINYQSIDIENPGYGWTEEYPAPKEVLPLNTALRTSNSIDQVRVTSADRSQSPEMMMRLNESPNVVLLYRLQALRSMSDSNFSLAILSLGYIGINVVLIFLNALNRNDDACEDPGSVYIARCGSPASDFLFHTLEFTGTFFFAVLQAFALLYTPKSLVKVYDNPLMLKCVLFFAIVSFLQACSPIAKLMPLILFYF